MNHRKKHRYEQKTLPEKKIDFKRHLRTYLVMSVFFVVLDSITYGASWAIWPILGWGIGVAMQGLSLYGPLADPEDTHPTENSQGTPLPDLEEKMELRELDINRPYREEDLV